MNFDDLLNDPRLPARRRFQKGDLLLYPDSDDYAILLLESGTVEVSRYDAEGERMLQNFMHAPQCFGLIEYLAEAPLLSGIRALTPGSFYSLHPGEALFQDAEVLRLLLAYIATLYERDMRINAFEKHMSGKERLLFALYHMARGPFPYALPLTREDLSDLLGLAPRSLYRYLAELEEAGYLTRPGGKITIDRSGYEAMKELFFDL